MSVDNREYVMILIDHDHRHKALSSVGQRDRHRSGIEVEHAYRIKRVAVAALDGVVVDWRQGTEMQELAEGVLLLEAGKDLVRLGPDEVVGGNRDARAGRRLRRRLRLCECRRRYGEQQACADLNAKIFHGVLPIDWTAIRSISGSTHILSKNGFSGP